MNSLCDYVKRNLEKMGFQTLDVRKIREGIFEIRTDKEKLILKTSRSIRNSHNNFIKKFLLKKTFKHEVRITRDLSSLSHHTEFNTPDLVLTDDASYMVIDYIEGTPVDYKQDYHIDRIVLSMLSFQFTRLRIQTNTFSKVIPSLLNNKFIGINQRLLSRRLKELTLKQKMKLVFIFVSASLKNKKVRVPFNLHNDLRVNTLLDKDSVLNIIDFESLVSEKKWVLTDILYCAFDSNSFSFNGKLFREYLIKLYENYGIAINGKALKTQTRMILCYIIIRLLSSSQRDAYKRMELVEFLKILLSKKEFNQWYSKNIDSTMHVNKGI
ncbi:hypothetical protein [Alkalibacillus haloalkaliphilus]|uniref:hypothetical protein n=1 Tax=Alkalibacillus haloalkaliphilus TaxID=94136 RepID=UPI0029358C8C|nr:hypothetical protein [Alkalibacillus haloalkaliphilus]MDV2582167.1 hypothetical protein [Alkalibacillus haloalkaliphilus]